MKPQAKYIVQLRTDPAFDVIDTTTGKVVSVWNDVTAADIDAAERLVMDLRATRRAHIVTSNSRSPIKCHP
jgi:hypothetical protein